jgi:phosphomannomutase
LVRYSGTENKIRLLLEGANESSLFAMMEELVAIVKTKLCDLKINI